MRFMFVCTSASKFPTNTVAIASADSTGIQIGLSTSSAAPKPFNTNRNNAPNAAAFTPTAMNPVTGVGAPSYTSGAHMWNGTAATLNPNPTTTNTNPTASNGS